MWAKAKKTHIEKKPPSKKPRGPKIL